MWRNSLEASAIARSPRCLVVSRSLILGHEHQARRGLVVKDQTAHQLGPWAVQYVCQSGSRNDVSHRSRSGHSPRPCQTQQRQGHRRPPRRRSGIRQTARRQHDGR